MQLHCPQGRLCVVLPQECGHLQALLLVSIPSETSLCPGSEDKGCQPRPHFFPTGGGNSAPSCWVWLLLEKASCVTLSEGWQRLVKLKPPDHGAGRGLSHHPILVPQIIDEKMRCREVNDLSKITQTSVAQTSEDL